ncbi:MAG: hypothetical protein IJN63_10315 [Clostridia bacterium]|nr:hypothetical protein [Clostridia bacterium]
MKKRLWLYIFAALMLICGTGVGVRFLLFGMEEIERGSNASSIVICFFMALLFFAGGCFGLLLFSFNKGAFLRIEGGRLLCRFGFNTSIDLPLEKIEDVFSDPAVVDVFAFGKNYRVPRIEGFEDAFSELEGLEAKPWTVNASEERKRYERFSRRRMASMLLMLVFGAVFVLNIILCVGLTDGKDISQFGNKEDGIWLFAFFFEVVVAALLFICAYLGGKATAESRRSLKRMASALGYAQRYEKVGAGTLIRIMLLDNYRWRVTVTYNYGQYIYGMYIMDTLKDEWALVHSEMCESLEELEERISLRIGEARIYEEKRF